MGVKAKLEAFVMLVSVTLCVLGCTARTDMGDTRGAGAAGDERRAPVEVMTVVRCDFEDAVIATGRFEANEVADISPKISGKIERIHFDEGDAVAAGDLIVTIEDNEMRLALERARAELKRTEADLTGAQRSFERAVELSQQGVAAEAHLDEAKRSFDVARASVEHARAEVGLAEQHLADTQIVAPIEGVLADRRYVAGELVQIGAPVFTLYQLDPIKLEIKVPERRTAELALGQNAAVTVDALGGTRCGGTIAYMSPSLDEISRNLMVRVVVPNRDMKIKPGMFARAEIDTAAHQDILAVPRDAVLFASDETEVFVIDNGVARQRRVALGATWRNFVEVASGLVEGDEIVIAGQHVLKDGLKVNIVARNDFNELLGASTPR